MTDRVDITCSEVWSGHGACDAAIELPGLLGWITARPHEGASGGGDVVLLSSCGTGRITRLLLADVSGHGEIVAEAAGRLQRVMQRYLNHVAPIRLAKRMNRDMGRLRLASGRHATALVMTYFSPDGGLSLCNAGHPPPLVYRRKAGRWAVIDQPDTADRIVNLPLGLLEEAGYVGRDLTLDPGDLLLCFTDCITEASNPQTGRMLQMAGLQQMVAALPAEQSIEQPGSLAASLLRKLEAEGYCIEDDLTIVVLQCTDRCGGSRLTRRLRGVLRSLAAPLRGGAAPWPELSWINLAGILMPRLRRRGRR